VGAEVYGKLNLSRPIRIDFDEKPLRKIDQGDVYTLKTSWRNTDRRRSYQGSFIFISTAKNISADYLTFTFDNATVTPVKSKNTLVFTLPKQTFLPGASGIVSVEVVYVKAGIYLWEIGVAQNY
jgi:hypothetical protein